MKEPAESLQAAWDEANRTGEPVPVGDFVICDVCGRDYTGAPNSGGFIFGSNAYCPLCAARALPSIRVHGEQRYIRASCAPDQSFADFVRAYRGAHATIRVIRVAQGG